MELKPCPFCGNTKPKLLREVGESWVLCRGCKASANMCSKEEDAIRAWNKRDQADLRKIVEELEAEGQRLVVIESEAATGYYQCVEKIKKLLDGGK